MSRVRVQIEPFDAAALAREVSGADGEAGAVVSFVGLVRDSNAGSRVRELYLEHYPGMTEKSIDTILEEAESRWRVRDIRVVHRIGRLYPGDPIVAVVVSSAHRGDAFSACEFIMDYLKTRAPFWKKETTPEGTRWVDARDSDSDAAERWRI